ncbi:MAG: translation initiation factor 2 [Desulfovibrio sp.]|nr:translation initiation factor 2 [Desulfovibrio sp.]
MRALVLFLALACLAAPAHAAGLSKSVSQYARDMEDYYKNGRPEVLPGLLRVFDSQGVLADGEKRLVTAAFLAQALRRDPSAKRHLLPQPGNFGVNARKTLAWAVHLACLPDEPVLLAALLAADDVVLLRQIQASPTPLERWNIYSELSVLRMYWAAFLASGDAGLLDTIIAAALRYADLSAAGLRGDADFAVSAAAAALLYEQVPHHEAVRARAQAALDKGPQTGSRADTLRSILRNTGR